MLPFEFWWRLIYLKVSNIVCVQYSQIHVSSSILVAVCQPTVSSCLVGSSMSQMLLVQNQRPHISSVSLLLANTVPPATQAQVPMFHSLFTEIYLITKCNSIYFTFTKFSEHSVPSLYLYPNCNTWVKTFIFFYYLVSLSFVLSMSRNSATVIFLKCNLIISFCPFKSSSVPLSLHKDKVNLLAWQIPCYPAPTNVFCHLQPSTPPA